ncbi:MAG: dihydroorotase [Fibrobacterota bacterium]
MTNIITLKNVHIVDPVSGIDREFDIRIEKGNVKEIGKIEGNKGKTFDLKGMFAVPGLVDMHVHLREPGREDEETVQSGCAAAAAGGFTAVACMPNTLPVLDDEASIDFINKRSRDASARVYPIGSITKSMKGSELTEMGAMVRAGAVGVSEDGISVKNACLMKNALIYSKMFEIPVICHCEDADLASGGCINEGSVSYCMGLKGIPSISEEIIVARDIMLAEYTGARVHIAHVSTAGSIALIRNAKKRGVKVTCETAPHYFSFTEEVLKDSLSTNFKMNPPLRSQKDLEAMIKAIKDGTIDVIASDHAPHSIEEKDVEFEAAPNGVTGLETSLGAVITNLLKPGHIDLQRLALLMSSNPNRILGKKGGVIKAGAPADITIVDKDKKWKVDPKNFVSKSRNNAFNNAELTGKAVMTIMEGRITYMDKSLKNE